MLWEPPSKKLHEKPHTEHGSYSRERIIGAQFRTELDGSIGEPSVTLHGINYGRERYRSSEFAGKTCQGNGEDTPILGKLERLIPLRFTCKNLNFKLRTVSEDFEALIYNAKG